MEDPFRAHHHSTVLVKHRRVRCFNSKNKTNRSEPGGKVIKLSVVFLNQLELASKNSTKRKQPLVAFRLTSSFSVVKS